MNTQLGCLELICGPMFAGKTTALLARLTAARDEGQTVVVIKPAGDTRSGADLIRTHAHEEWPARSVAHAGEIVDAAGEAEMVGIDEAHFFEPELANVCNALVERGVRVIVAGVDFDHRGELFDVMARLVTSADEITRLTSRCARCGAEAQYTQRLMTSDARIVVGGAETYEPRCEDCFERAND